LDEHRKIEMPDRAHARIRRPRKPRAPCHRAAAPWAWATTLLLPLVAVVSIALVSPPTAQAAKPEAASTSRSTCDEAIRAIPHDKLSAESQEKVAAVLSQISIFRRLPTQVIECDPNLYLFLVEHPDMVVNMWEVMDVSDMRLEKTAEDKYRANDGAGTAGHVEYLYRSYDTHIIYADGSYSGPLFINQVNGRCLLVLKTGYVRETNDRYYITCRLDAFIQLKNVGVELVAKTFQPLVGKTADHNFRETAAFMALVSRSAETKPDALERLTSKLTKVPDTDRNQFRDIAGELAMAALERDSSSANSSTGKRKTALKPVTSGGR
jgi:hypothetical protein